MGTLPRPSAEGREAALAGLPDGGLLGVHRSEQAGALADARSPEAGIDSQRIAP